MHNDYDVQTFVDEDLSTIPTSADSLVNTSSSPIPSGTTYSGTTSSGIIDNKSTDNKPLVVLVVDDDEAIHTVTRYALKHFTFQEQRIEILSAYSAAEARQILASTPNIAVILLDVVMDGRDAGLQLVKHIRNELCNSFVRIVLRTGQPDEAPEFEVIRHYDINDYRSKTELSDVRLMTVITVALRAYKHMVELEKFRYQLEILVDERTQELQHTHKNLQYAYDKLNETNTELHAVNQFKTQILSVVAHDLKNPVSAITGFAGIALFELENQEFSRELLHTALHSIETTSSSMMSLITNLLDSAAIEMGEMSVVPDNFYLGSLVGAVTDSFSELAERKNQHIQIELEENILITADSQRLRQVFENLLSNAIKYSPLNSTVHVRLYSSPAKRSPANSSPAKLHEKKPHSSITEMSKEMSEEMKTETTTVIPTDRKTEMQHIARIEVEDQGPGISEEDKALMFRFFQRLSAHPTGGESSHGVGLAIAKKIVALHNGKIWVESRKDEGIPGTTFVVELPTLGHNRTT